MGLPPSLRGTLKLKFYISDNGIKYEAELRITILL
jgi:hypothetical protein